MTVHPPINDAEFNTVIEQRDWARGYAAQVEAENARLIDAAADVEVLRRELAAANAENAEWIRKSDAIEAVLRQDGLAADIRCRAALREIGTGL